MNKCKFIKIFRIIFTIMTITLSLCGAYYLGTTQYINTHSKDFKEQYIDTNAIKSVIETKDGFEIYTNDGNVFFFDCVKEREAISCQ